MPSGSGRLSSSNNSPPLGASMLLHPRHFLCAFALVALAFCPARADDAENVKKKLAEARKVYTEEAERFKQAVTDFLDKREEDARKAGNKKLLDQVKVERAAFEQQSELPAA